MGSNVQLKAADAHELQAYVAKPSGTARGAVVVVQEIFGVNSHIRSVADGFAADGYLAIAPAMFDRAQRNYEAGYSQPEISAGVEMKNKVSWDQAVADVAAAVEYGKSAGKVGIVGYCWGGAVVWASAARLPGIACAVAYYGGSIPSLVNEKPRCPIMLHFGEKDHSIPIEKAKEVAARHPEAVTYYYAAGHGFNCEQRGSYDAAAAKTARERTLEFFRKHIG
ncbi:MAG TPA: dienelactone hydrolase family protein [Usitatibacter sp.]|nr:dienelactone hydrolase family protein [Usitatibacter sp.]